LLEIAALAHNPLRHPDSK
jgi:hypothetical protein